MKQLIVTGLSAIAPRAQGRGARGKLASKSCRKGLVAGLALMVGLAALPANAEGPSHLAVSLPDASILIEHQADAPRRPASLVKLMTGYLAFEALRDGEVSPNMSVVVSRRAAQQPPVKLHLRKGDVVPFDELLAAAMVGSKNDAAVAIAEAISGSEAAFVERMNQTAARLGLTNTVYGSATGLPRPGQVTTARDVALLARALLRDFPRRSKLFAQRSTRAKGRAVSTTNPLFGRVAGSAGMKTGFTCAAGYSIAALIERDGRQMIAVTLGHPSKQDRLKRIKTLIDAAADVPGGSGALIPALKKMDTPPDMRACSGRGAEIVATDIPLPVDADLYLAGIAAAPRPLEERAYPSFPPIGEGSAPLSPLAESFNILASLPPAGVAGPAGDAKLDLRPRIPTVSGPVSRRQSFAPSGNALSTPLKTLGQRQSANQAARQKLAGQRQAALFPPPAVGPTNLPEQPKRPPAAKPPPPLHGWGSYLGPQRNRESANAIMAQIAKRAGPVTRHAKLVPRLRDKKPLAVLYGLSKDTATLHCSIARSLGVFCLTLSPGRLTNERARWRR